MSATMGGKRFGASSRNRGAGKTESIKRLPGAFKKSLRIDQKDPSND